MADLLYDVLRVNDTDANIVGGLIKQLQWAWATDTSKLIARDALGYHKIPSEGINTYFNGLGVGYTSSPTLTATLQVNGDSQFNGLLNITDNGQSGSIEVLATGELQLLDANYKLTTLPFNGGAVDGYGIEFDENSGIGFFGYNDGLGTQYSGIAMPSGGSGAPYLIVQSGAGAFAHSIDGDFSILNSGSLLINTSAGNTTITSSGLSGTDAAGTYSIDSEYITSSLSSGLGAVSISGTQALFSSGASLVNQIKLNTSLNTIQLLDGTYTTTYGLNSATIATTTGNIVLSSSGVVGTFGSTSFNLNPTTVALSDGSETATFQTSGANLPLTRDYKINGESFLVNAKMATGFTDPSAVVVTYDSTARTITLTGTVKAFYQGQEIEALVSSWVSSAHGTGSGSFFLYHDGSTFQWTSTPWDFNEVPIAYVFKNASYQFALREPHGMVISGASHKEAHENIGTYIASGAGGDFSGYTLSSTTAADRRPDISALTINDEDIPTTNAQLLEASADYTQFYLSSTDTTNVDESNADIISLSGNQPYFNEFSGGTWGQTLMSNNYYAKIFVLATPASADAESQRKRFLFIQPQSQQATLTACQAITSADISLGELGAALTEFSFCGEIIIRYTAGNWQLVEVNKITGNKLNQTSSVQGNFLSTVSTDATLTGDGTSGSPLSVVSSSQWTTSGSDIYYPTGNVGFGPNSSAPKSLVHLIDNSATEVCAQFSNSLTGIGTGSGLCVGVDTSGNAILNNYTNSDMIFKTWNGSGGTLTFDSGGDLYTETLTDYHSTSTKTGLSTAVRTTLQYKTIGKILYLYINFGGTSNAGTFTFTIPYNCVHTLEIPVVVYDNGVRQDTGWIATSAGSNVLSVFLDGAQTAFTASGLKNVAGSFPLEIQ